MVDYTKPAMRDETWRRWKGGSKLADELRNFYTNERVWKRQAVQNPMGPALPPAASAALKGRYGVYGDKRPTMADGKYGFFGGNVMHSGGAMRSRALARMMLSHKSAEEQRSPASQSGATL